MPAAAVHGRKSVCVYLSVSVFVCLCVCLFGKGRWRCVVTWDAVGGELGWGEVVVQRRLDSRGRPCSWLLKSVDFLQTCP